MNVEPKKINQQRTKLVSQSGLTTRMRNLLLVIFNQIRWKWRFGFFGSRSRLESCLMLTNPGQISIGNKCLIRKQARLEALGPNDNRFKIEIGDGTAAQFNFHCAAVDSVKIGKDVLIAGGVYISDHDHVSDHPEFPPRKCNEVVSGPVQIGDGAWLGESVVVLKGVNIGKRAVIGANAVVTKDIPDYAIAAGVPAKVIGKIDINKNQRKSLELTR